MSDFSINFVQFTVKEENKKSDKSPDVTGNIEVPAEEVNALISYLQNAERVLDWQDKEVVKIRLAGWNREIKKGKNQGDPFLSGKLSSPYVPENKPAAESKPASAAALLFYEANHQAGQRKRDLALGSLLCRHGSQIPV